MAILYEVLYREGETELKKFVLAENEQDLVAYLEPQALDGMAYFNVAENTDVDFSLVAGPSQLTKAADGRWDETA